MHDALLVGLEDGQVQQLEPCILGLGMHQQRHGLGLADEHTAVVAGLGHQPDLVHDAGENDMESFVLTRSDAVMRSASSAALFADTKGGDADRWRRRPAAPGRTQRAAAAALVFEASGAAGGRHGAGRLRHILGRSGTDGGGLTGLTELDGGGSVQNAHIRVGGVAGAYVQNVPISVHSLWMKILWC